MINVETRVACCAMANIVTTITGAFLRGGDEQQHEKDQTRRRGLGDVKILMSGTEQQVTNAEHRPGKPASHWSVKTDHNAVVFPQ